MITTKIHLVKLIALAIITSFLYTQAQAQGNYFETIDFYAGIGGGLSAVEIDGLSVGNGTSLDNRDSTVKLFAGADFNDYLGLEIAYVNLGTAALNVPVNGTIGFNGSTGTAAIASSTNITATTFTIAPTIGYQVNGWFRPYVKIGVHAWKQNGSITVGSTRANFDEDGNDIFWGLGLQFKIPDTSIGLRAELESYSLDNDTVSTATIGASIYF